MIDITSLPYSQLIGLSETSIAGKKVISLEPTESHQNHVGTVHAAAVFSVAEAASAQALLDGFPQLVDKAVAILRSSRVKYRKPATAAIHGQANIDDDSADEFLRRFERKGVALLSVSATVFQGEEVLLTGEFSWFVSRLE